MFKEILGNFYDVSVKSVTTNELFDAVGPPPWYSETGNLQSSNLQEQICGRVKQFNDSSYFYQLPYSLIRLAWIDYSPPLRRPSKNTSQTFFSSNMPEYIIGFNTYARHSLPIAINLLSNLLLDIKLRENMDNVTATAESSYIGISSHQLPFNVRNEQRQEFMENRLSMLLFSPFVLIAALGGMIILAFAGAEIVAEKEVRICYDQSF